MSNLSAFEGLIIESPISATLCSYLDILDIKNLCFSSKNIYLSPETMFFIKLIIKQRSVSLIKKVFTRYCKIIGNMNNIIGENSQFFPSERYYYYTPFYFYRYYPRDCVNAYFKCTQKKLYKNDTYEHDNDKTKSDLFNLIRHLSNEEISYIGW
jgi:hypothetical protein